MAVLTILALGAMGLLIAAVGHVGIARERRAILAAQAQLAAAAAPTEASPKAQQPVTGKAGARQFRLDGQRVTAAPQKPKRIRTK
ncbi:MAG: hypothetical protein RIR62_289 [Pseudomonadota bacterium]